MTPPFHVEPPPEPACDPASFHVEPASQAPRQPSFHVEQDLGAGGVPEPPPSASAVFGDRLDLARRYVGHLASTGVQWGLLGPREVPRLWERHVLNCAVLTDLLPVGARVADVGSGAGLPGIALALRRPDLQVVLVEPLLRRVEWLAMVLDDLDLGTVSVQRARAEDLAGTLRVPFVTARAVAPLDRLARWGLPLLAPHGELLALKGRSAAVEVERSAAGVRRAGGRGTEIVELAADLLGEPVTVVRVRVGGAPARPPRGGRPRPSALEGSP